MTSLVLDTHAVIWYLLRSPRLPARVLARIQETLAAGGWVYISAVSVLDLVYLIEKSRVSRAALDRLLAVLADPASGIVAAPFDVPVALAARRHSVSTIRDMPDRIIAATTAHLNLPLATCNRLISASGLDVLW